MGNDDLIAYLAMAMNQSDAHYKALANFMFREIIEDAHKKYNISDEDMKEMCKMAVNRVMVYNGMMQKLRTMLRNNTNY